MRSDTPNGEKHSYSCTQGAFNIAHTPEEKKPQIKGESDKNCLLFMDRSQLIKYLDTPVTPKKEKIDLNNIKPEDYNL